MTPASVVAACNDWVWVPDTATTVETPDYLLVRFPDWFVHPLELLRFEPSGPVEPAVDDVLARARELGTDALNWWVKLGAPAGLDDLVRARGGVPDETLDVLALDLAGRRPDAARDGLTLRWEADLATARDSHAVATDVFGGDVPPEDQLLALADRGRVDVAEGRGGTLVAYLDDRPVGTGGLSLVDGVARLWGGAVLEEFRGRGVYGALLAARLAYGSEQGARMALVKGRVETSGPILRRAGFAAYGQERSYRVPLR